MFSLCHGCVDRGGAFVRIGDKKCTLYDLIDKKRIIYVSGGIYGYKVS